MKIIEICGDWNYPPFEFINEFGECSGFNVDVTNSIGNNMGFEAKYNLINWTDAIEGLDNGKYQAIQGMSITEERKKDYIFSDEYFTVIHSAFRLKERNDIATLNDILDKRIAVQENDIGYDLLINMAKKPLHIILVDVQQTALKKLLDKEVDVIIGNSVTILNCAENTGSFNLIKSIGNPLNTTKIGVGFKKNRRDLKELFDEGLSKIKSNGEYQKIYNKWIRGKVDNVKIEIIEKVNSGIICLNNLGYITAINDTSLCILNINKDCNLFKSYFESELHDLVDPAIIQEFLFNDMDTYYRQISYRSRGIDLILDVNVSSLINYNNDDMGIIINIRDITQEKKNEEALITKDKMESLGRLLLNVAHEIRNPLTSIKNFITILPKNLENKEFIDALLLHVPKQIDIIDVLVKDLLEYSSPRNTNKKIVNMGLFLDSVLALPRREKSNIEFEIDMKNEINLLTDEQHLRQILVNLIMNGMDSIENKNGLIRISVSEDDEDVVITIQDNGTGIDKENLIRIFDPFFTTKEKGTGLGLFITYQLVKKNNGSISVDSSPEGTAFTLRFPYNHTI